jgi:hypothetical protein
VNRFIGADTAKQGESAELHLSFLSVCSIDPDFPEPLVSEISGIAE